MFFWAVRRVSEASEQKGKKGRRTARKASCTYSSDSARPHKQALPAHQTATRQQSSVSSSPSMTTHSSPLVPPSSSSRAVMLRHRTARRCVCGFRPVGAGGYGTGASRGSRCIRSAFGEGQRRGCERQGDGPVVDVEGVDCHDAWNNSKEECGGGVNGSEWIKGKLFISRISRQRSPGGG